MCLLGIDIGTSGCKASIVETSGRLSSEAYQEYFLISEKPGWQELDPDQVWTAVVNVLKNALTHHRGPAIRAISVSSFGEATVAINREGAVLCNSMIYIDSRGLDQANHLRSRISDERVLAITGTAIDPMYSLCKIMWLKEHRPHIYQQTWKFMLFADFILFRLGARPATDYSLATRTMAFDVVHKKWSREMLDAAGIDPAKFCDPVLSGTPIGVLSPVVSKAFYLPQDVMLVAGGHDQTCAALGAGVIRPGLAVDDLGTTECITPVFDQPILTSAMASNYYASVPHVLPDLYVTYAFTFTCGSVLKWLREILGNSFASEAALKDQNVYEYLIEQASPEPSSLFVLPHFAGAATPYMDHASKGAVLGLTINTQRGDLIKGVLEGLTFEIMLNLERLAAAGVEVEELIAVGGLSRSAAFLQLKANMMGKKVTTLKVSEAGTIGVAILAGTACGVYRDVPAAIRHLVKPDKTYMPDPQIHDFYQNKFEKYKGLYSAIRSFSPSM